MPLQYRIYISEPAVLFLGGLTTRQRKIVLQFVRLIGAHPSQSGDYHEPDDAGRRIEVTVIESFAVLWWVDHAAAEIKVADIRSAG